MTTKHSGANDLRFRWFNTGDEFFEETLRAIAEARTSVRLETYIFTAGAVGDQFRDALKQAARDGRRVQVLIDSWGSMTLPDAFWESAREAGVQVRWFNPLSLERYAIRDHRKLLVCDERIAFVGGYNIASEYAGDGVTRGWRDCGAAVQGALAKELARSFDTMYALADFAHKRFARFRKASVRHMVRTREGEILLTGPGRGRNLLKRALLQDLKKATRVKIMAAYFVPTRPIRRALTRVARRGGKVQIIVAGKSDVPLTQMAGRRFYQSYLNAGVEVYEYQPQVLHAKLVIVDGVVYVGSANLDPRSFYINYELVLRLLEPRLAAETEAMFAQDLPLCQRIDARAWRRSRTVWNKLKERWAYFLVARVDPYLARRQMRTLR